MKKGRTQILRTRPALKFKQELDSGLAQRKPSDFRATTKMAPIFRLKRRNRSRPSPPIFWQSRAKRIHLPKHKPGNAAHGKRAVRNAAAGPRPATPSGEGDPVAGRNFLPANLHACGVRRTATTTLVRWVHNGHARGATRPFTCPYEKKDIGPRRLQKRRALPLLSLEPGPQAGGPNDGHETASYRNHEP